MLTKYKYYFYEKTSDGRYRVLESVIRVGITTVCFCDAEFHAADVVTAMNHRFGTWRTDNTQIKG